MKLAIISHTEHYKTSNGKIVGWGPTINEINHLLEVFDEIYHVAMLHEGEPPKSALPYISDKIIFTGIPAVGGIGLKQKMKILLKACKVITIVNKTLKKVDCFQLRTPTGIGVFLIPYLTFFQNKKGWFKYAGNWNQKHPPLGYRLQRWMLKHQRRKVTINGKWINQPITHLTFENPCLTNEDISEGKKIRNNKLLPKKWSFCFVGRLEKEKGVERIILAMSALRNNNDIDVVHFVGEGENDSYFKELSKNSSINMKFHGGLSRLEVFKIYKTSDVFLLPTTASEGFPKVIAEAMNFGCIPIVSNISAIGHYIENNENGFLLNDVSQEPLVKALEKLVDRSNQKSYLSLLNNMDGVVKKFTYAHYNKRITEEILNV